MSWHPKAKCLDVKGDPFFPQRGNYSRALAICASCPVSAECLDEALTQETDALSGRYGMRGGLTPDERYQLAAR